MELARRYEAWRGVAAAHCYEGFLLTPPRKLSELELQSRWFAGEFGTRFTSTEGEEIEIIQFGVWNHEAGPDFIQASVAINGRAPVHGAIELDNQARDWERHGHSTNRDYNPVILHLFLNRGPEDFFTRTSEHRNVPQVELDLSKLGDDPPNPNPVAKLGRCSALLQSLPEPRIREVLEAAAQYRLQKKAARLARLAELHGREEALYQAVAVTLGYKANTVPFLLLAQRFPIRQALRSKADLYALFFGIGGFLDRADLSGLDPEARAYLRAIWEKWWPHRGEFDRLGLTADLWRRTGQRPLNHPQRRLAGLAQMVLHWGKLRSLAEQCDVARLRVFFAELRDDFWQHRYTLTSARAERSLALVGQSRVTEMLANVFIPQALLSNRSHWETFLRLPADMSSRRVKIAALRLFGDHPQRPALLRKVVHQQGLLQIYEDFCMKDASNCARCPFPCQVGQWKL